MLVDVLRAGYYATMAVEKGCVGFCGTNARPSIAPTFGVAFPCLQVEDGLMGCVGVGFTVAF